jgi:predicted AlkP superfamily phosphohydrolase/phosphomutase
MPETPAKVICIGVDAANPDLVREWASTGLLPTFRSLFERGLSGDIRGIEGFFVGSTWPSFYSGVSPAGHGFHYLVQLLPESYTLNRPEEDGISLRAPFWTHLSGAGRRVAILDVPLTRLDPSLNGVQVVEWGGHDSVYGFQTAPADLAHEIHSRFGTHPLGPSCDGVRKTPEDYRAFLDKLVSGARTKGEMTRSLLHLGEWDLFMQVFTEAHCVGHQCWHLHDSTHPAFDPAIAETVGDPLLHVYQAIDSAVGEIVQAAGDALVVVFSAHGMAHCYGAHFLLQEILFRLEVASPEQKDCVPTGGVLGPLAALRAGWRRLPQGVRAFLAPVRDRIRGSGAPGEGTPVLGVDFPSSFCFALPNGLAVGGIRLNLKGREPMGLLEPEAAPAFCGRLSQDLLAILDERTGRPLIKRVLRTAEIHVGKHLDRLPDLLVEWDDGVATGSLSLGEGTAATVRAFSERTGALEGENEYGRSGEHRARGFFVAAGPDVQSGNLDRDVSLLDLAPTLTKRLGVELPDAEGVLIPELLGGSGQDHT